MTGTRDRTDPLDEALASLEPRSASPGFTNRVLAALEDADRLAPRIGGIGGRAWALAAAALVAVAVGIYFGARPEPPMAALAAEREDLRLEHDELMRELESLRSLARETRPVLYLGSGDEVDYVLDLSPLVEQPVMEPGLRPAGLEDGEQNPRYY